MENRKFFGFLNIYKPVGMTSHDVVVVLRRITGVKQIGHTGTLDPFAEGVLPVAIGKATRLIEYLSDDKAYIGRFCFGKSTTTYDTEGDIVQEFDKEISEDEIVAVLKDFQGEISQYPPIYSAIKVNGKKLYDYARAGENVDIQPRTVNIFKIELKEFNKNEQWADIYIECSKGTYIRSIANDIGEKLNNGCYLSKLQRVKSGYFVLDTANLLDNLKTPEDAERILLNPIEYIDLPKQELNETEYNRIIHGMPVYNRINATEGKVVLTKNGALIAISEVNSVGLKAKKVISV